MSKKEYTDEEIVQGLQGTAAARDAALRSLFLDQALKGYIIGYVQRNGGNVQDGEDIHQDAIILLDRRVRQGGYRGAGSIGGYLQGIARRLWLRKRERWQNRTEELDPANEEEETAESPELIFISEERLSVIREVLAKLGDKCRELLELYKLEHSMEEIAAKMGFGSKDVAKNEAYRCRKRFREFVEAREGYREVLGISNSRN